MKRQKKKYSKPRKPFDKVRMDEEEILVRKYGLKNKREIWKAESAISRIRSKAKKLIVAAEEKKKAFVENLHQKGFKVENIADVLALNKEDWLKRRLQTIVFAKGFAHTPNQARQFIVHKHILIGDQTVNIPSYQVEVSEESLLKLNIVLKTPESQKSKMEEIKEEILEENDQ
ncbi:30S ribosomal protein S4 [Candidatus Pacearchaeota archaeon]|nr:30S ribosomal protein S4 [Candidatus Pacearchaeota archaeon]